MAFNEIALLRDFSHLLYFVLLTGAIASFWILPKSVTILLALVAGGVGMWLSHIHFVAVLSLTIMGMLVFSYYKLGSSLWVKFALFLGVATLGWLFYEHRVPGFQNFIWAKNVHLSFDTIAYGFYLNADSIFVALMLLIAVPSFNRRLKDWQETVRVLPLPFLYVTLILLGTAFAAHYIRIDFKAPALLLWWVPANLFLVCATEEIFFRGYIQSQLSLFLNPFPGGKWVALAIASLLFGLHHHTGGPTYILLATLAGAGYGYAYQRSTRIESSILLHFLVNLIHILIFSYPALMRESVALS